MTAIAALRGLTLIVRILLAFILWSLVRRGGTLPRAVQHAWIALAIAASVFALDTLLGEVTAAFHAGMGPALQETLYQSAYLLNAVTGAALPLALIGLLIVGALVRRVVAGLTLVLLLYGCFAALRGAATDWVDLFDATRWFSFANIAGYLVFWAMIVLRRAAVLDVYLAGFIGIDTVFVLMVPVQEVFFQSAGRPGARDLWALLQTLQLAACAAQFGISCAVILATQRRAALPPLRLGGALS